MKCEKCGFDNPISNLKCEKCNTLLPNSVKEKKKNNKLKGRLIAGAISIAIITTFMFNSVAYSLDVNLGRFDYDVKYFLDLDASNLKEETKEENIDYVYFEFRTDSLARISNVGYSQKYTYKEDDGKIKFSLYNDSYDEEDNDYEYDEYDEYEEKAMIGEKKGDEIRITYDDEEYVFRKENSEKWSKSDRNRLIAVSAAINNKGTGVIQSEGEAYIWSRLAIMYEKIEKNDKIVYKINDDQQKNTNLLANKGLNNDQYIFAEVKSMPGGTIDESDVDVIKQYDNLNNEYKYKDLSEYISESGKDVGGASYFIVMNENNSRVGVLISEYDIFGKCIKKL